MKKGGGGLGASAVLSLGTIQRSWGGREYLCAFSGSSISSLYATWTVPSGMAARCGHHVYAGFSLYVCFFPWYVFFVGVCLVRVTIVVRRCKA